jgi:hypothetical protein
MNIHRQWEPNLQDVRKRSLGQALLERWAFRSITGRYLRSAKRLAS